jgi:hypothetical protein
MTIQMADTKDEAKNQHENTVMDPNAAQLYTDGSGIENKIGAAIYQMDTNTTRLQHLGSETQYNVFAAELKFGLKGFKAEGNSTDIVRARLFMYRAKKRSFATEWLLKECVILSQSWSWIWYLIFVGTTYQ